MSSDFWWGVAVIPAAVLAICVTAGAIAGLIWLSAHFRVNEYKLLKRSEDHNRANLAATMVCAKWVRYCWIPGWHLVLCRTTLYGRGGDAIEHRHRQVRASVQATVARTED